MDHKILWTIHPYLILVNGEPALVHSEVGQPANQLVQEEWLLVLEAKEF